MFELQGTLCLAAKIFEGAIRAFERMSNVAIESDNKIFEMKAYFEIANVFQI